MGPGQSSPHYRTDIDYGDDPSKTIVVEESVCTSEDLLGLGLRVIPFTSYQ